MQRNLLFTALALVLSSTMAVSAAKVTKAGEWTLNDADWDSVWWNNKGYFLVGKTNSAGLAITVHKKGKQVSSGTVAEAADADEARVAAPTDFKKVICYVRKDTNVVFYSYSAGKTFKKVGDFDTIEVGDLKTPVMDSFGKDVFFQQRITTTDSLVDKLRFARFDPSLKKKFEQNIDVYTNGYVKYSPHGKFVTVMTNSDGTTATLKILKPGKKFLIEVMNALGSQEGTFAYHGEKDKVVSTETSDVGTYQVAKIAPMSYLPQYSYSDGGLADTYTGTKGNTALLFTNNTVSVARKKALTDPITIAGIASTDTVEIVYFRKNKIILQVKTATGYNIVGYKLRKNVATPFKTSITSAADVFSSVVAIGNRILLFETSGTAPDIKIGMRVYTTALKQLSGDVPASDNILPAEGMAMAVNKGTGANTFTLYTWGARAVSCGHEQQ